MLSLLSLSHLPFSTNVPLMDKPGSWFLLAKCLKNTCGSVALVENGIIKSVSVIANQLLFTFRSHNENKVFA